MQIFVCNSSDFIRRYERQKEVEVKEGKSREREREVQTKMREAQGTMVNRGQWSIGDVMGMTGRERKRERDHLLRWVTSGEIKIVRRLI